MPPVSTYHHDKLAGYVANEHIDWTNASDNLLTTGSGTFGHLDVIETTLGSFYGPAATVTIKGELDGVVVFPLHVTHSKFDDGVTYDGFGVGIRFDNEVDDGVTTTGEIISQTTDVSSGTEDADMIFKTMIGGSITEWARYDESLDAFLFTGFTETNILNCAGFGTGTTTIDASNPGLDMGGRTLYFGTPNFDFVDSNDVILVQFYEGTGILVNGMLGATQLSSLALGVEAIAGEHETIEHTWVGGTGTNFSPTTTREIGPGVFSINDLGNATYRWDNLYLDEDIHFNTGDGTKIGTAANQKLAFFGDTPVVQRAKADYNNWAAFGDVVNALVALGLFDTA